MSVQMMGAVISCGPQDRTQFCVMVTLANYADDFGFAFPSIETIAANSRCDERTARRQLIELQQRGWIHIARKVVKGKSNAYILNIEKLGVRVPGDARRNPMFMRLLKSYAGTMTPIFAPEKSEDKPTFSEDNPQPIQRAPKQTQRTFEGGSADIACPPNRYNRQEPSGTINEVEPSASGADGVVEAVENPRTHLADLDAERWQRVRTALKIDIPVSFVRSAPLRPNQQDYDVAFRDWWLQAVTVLPVANGLLDWKFETLAGDVPGTRDGIARYRTKLERTLRRFFPIPHTALIEFEIRPAAAIEGKP